MPLRHMLDEFGGTTLSKINHECVEAVRQKMVLEQLCVATINGYVRKMRHIWKWFANQRFVGVEVWHEMQTIAALSPGRPLKCGNTTLTPRVTDAVKDVPEETVMETVALLPRTIGAMVMVQYWTGARPTEICIMRPVDFDTTGSIWSYKPSQHKTQHHGKPRCIAIGPRAQEWLKPVLAECHELHGYVFRPIDAWKDRFAEKNANYQPENPRGGMMFDRTTYARAIARVCKNNGIPPWSPNQLRHSAAKRARLEMGIEAASAMLGHSKVSTTEIYAKTMIENAKTVAERVG